MCVPGGCCPESSADRCEGLEATCRSFTNAECPEEDDCCPREMPYCVLVSGRAACSVTVGDAADGEWNRTETETEAGSGSGVEVDTRTRVEDEVQVSETPVTSGNGEGNRKTTGSDGTRLEVLQMGMLIWVALGVAVSVL